MAHALCAEELPEFLHVAGAARRLRRIAGGDPRARLAGCAAAMAMSVAVGRDGHPELATDVHCRDADLHRFHLQLAPCRGRDRERPAYPAHHLHDPASRQDARLQRHSLVFERTDHEIVFQGDGRWRRAVPASRRAGLVHSELCGPLGRQDCPTHLRRARAGRAGRRRGDRRGHRSGDPGAGGPVTWRRDVCPHRRRATDQSLGRYSAACRSIRCSRAWWKASCNSRRPPTSSLPW
jgi:hypothetical protein